MWYITVASAVFVYWLGLFIADTSTPKNHVDSWLVLLIAPWFWPIVVPMSILELTRKASKKKKAQTTISLNLTSDLTD